MIIQPDMFGATDRQIMDEGRRQKRRVALPDGLLSVRRGDGPELPVIDGAIVDGGVAFRVIDWVSIQKRRNYAVYVTFRDLADVLTAEV